MSDWKKKKLEEHFNELKCLATAEPRATRFVRNIIGGAQVGISTAKMCLRRLGKMPFTNAPLMKYSTRL
jgi:hypothetical protein